MVVDVNFIYLRLKSLLKYDFFNIIFFSFFSKSYVFYVVEQYEEFGVDKVKVGKDFLVN